jgi:GTP-binding protein HflX
VASFRSTLSEVHDADLLFHVVDAAHPGRDELMSTVHEVIQTLLGEEVPMIHVFNKTDLLTNLELKTLKRQFPQAIFLSALNGAGLEQLRTQVLQRFEHRLDQRIYFLRNQDMGEFHHLREYGQVLQTRTHEEGLLIAFRAMKESLDAFERQFPQFFPSSSAAMEPLADASAHENVPQEDFPSPTLGK